LAFRVIVVVVRRLTGWKIDDDNDHDDEFEFEK
jgi:hypothetical protein